MDGILNVYKEPGYTSFDVVAKLRGILHQKKIGHTGTLDPDAEGVLPVCLGKATKVCELLTERDKTYLAVCRLGIETDTQDLSGKVLKCREIKAVTAEQIQRTAGRYLGESWQVPPMYSALKVQGKRLYELAREGKTVERKPRRIYITALDVLEMDLKEGTFTMKVTCSKGTYIRTLCHDIGQALGCGAAMEHLTRTEASGFRIEDALTLAEIADLAEQGMPMLQERITSVDALFPTMRRGRVSAQADAWLANGNRLPGDAVQWLKDELEPIRPGESILLYDVRGSFRAVYEFTGTDYKVMKMF